MIEKIALFACAIWFTYFVTNLLFVAATKGYVMALTNPFDLGARETPQTRTDAPTKFWANVVCAIVLLPIALGGLYFTGSELWNALRSQGS